MAFTSPPDCQYSGLPGFGDLEITEKPAPCPECPSCPDPEAFDFAAAFDSLEATLQHSGTLRGRDQRRALKSVARCEHLREKSAERARKECQKDCEDKVKQAVSTALESEKGRATRRYHRYKGENKALKKEVKRLHNLLEDSKRVVPLAVWYIGAVLIAGGLVVFLLRKLRVF